MDIPTRDDLETLAEGARGPCVSVYLPTHRTGEGIQQDPIRLKNLLRIAERGLVDGGLRETTARDLLQPAARLLEDQDFWQHQGDGLALFLDGEGLRRYRVPLGFEELAVVGERFHLKPLLSIFTGDGRYFVLALSQNAIRLLQCSRHHVSAVDLEEAPKSLAEALRFDDPERQLQFHTGTGGGGNRPAMFHGQGVQNEDEKKDLLRFFRMVDDGLRETLGDERAPLVLAGVDYLLPLYREASRYSHLVEEGVEGNPEHVPDRELRERAWSVVEPIFTRDLRALREEYEERANRDDGTASAALETVETAAHAGRVRALFVERHAHRWGRFEPTSAALELHDEPRSGDEDLLDLAAVRTLMTGGTVYSVPAEEMPNDSPVAALMRY